MTGAATRPIVTAPLFEELDGKLIELLESLNERDWTRATIVPRWNVKQIAAHLLDTALRRLSLDRDREPPPADAPRIEGPADLARLVNDLNARGVEIYGRLSGRVLITLLRVACRDLREHFLSLDPMANATWSVSWAGEDRSLNWFDIAREFTERWHHQQQIRLAVDRPGIMTPPLYHPVLDTFLRALPFAYRFVSAATGDVVTVRIAGDCGGTWHVRKMPEGWAIIDEADTAIGSVTIPQDLAWRIFTKGMPYDEARGHVTVEGDERAATAVLKMIAIVG